VKSRKNYNVKNNALMQTNYQRKRNSTMKEGQTQKSRQKDQP